jgi:UDP-N-acetylmuramoyl-L-alanyl-D-glutamate--2,6-diaminopimelate ligase
MTLRELFRSAFARELPADERFDDVVTGVAQASDRVVPGSLFVARPGLVTDGHTYAADAAARGAAAIVGERRNVATLHGLPYLRLDDARADIATLAAAFHDHPSRAMTVVGVTGTDGKTTTSFLLHHLLSERFATGLVGTAGIRLRHEPLPLEGHFTSAEAPEVQALLARFRDAGLDHVVLESSSHGLALHRLDAVAYDLAVWTNLSPEHLDFHGDMAGYLAAKRLLVERAGAAVLNRDDPHYPAFAAAAAEAIPYGLDAKSIWRASDVEARPGALGFTLAVGADRYRAHLPMVGGYNVHNALAALAAADRLGLPPTTTLPRLATFPGVPGRMQIVQRDPFLALVDFAHTPPALAKALTALRPLTAGRLIVVIGSAGERDPGKRAPLGRAAASHADLAILTEEDHRSEPLAPILAEMARGADAAGAREGEGYLRVGDRSEAIREAVSQARQGDTVVLAGKGHEATLERSDEVLAWDEVAELEEALRR